jgi:DNA-binding LytR/AlgR family response regulator
MEKKLSVLIVDDEQDARDVLRYFLQEIPSVERIEEASNSEETLFKYIETNPDIVFMDIVMPGRDGAELIELLKGKDPNCNIIIVSSYKDSAIMAIQNGIYDFLLKPIDFNILQEKVEKFQAQIQASIENKIQKALNNVDKVTKLKIASTYNHILIDPSEILYIEADGPYSVMTMQNGTKELANTYLGRLENILSEQRFFRLSRSILINLDKLSQVNKIDNTCTLLGTNVEVCLSGSKKQIKILCEMDLS